MASLFSKPPGRPHAPDYVIIVCTILLIVIGLAMLTSASSDRGQVNFGDSYFYLKHQIFYGLTLGIAGFLLGSRMYYRRWQSMAIPLIAVSFFLLALVFTPFGLRSGGAARWIQLGPVAFQPSEFLKITFIVYIASWLSTRTNRHQEFWGGYFPFLAILGVTSLLLIFQPSTSVAAVLVTSALIMYFASGARLSYIFGTMLICVVGLAVLALVTPYRLQRIMTFMHPDTNTQGSGYQINQALTAIGSGGLWGVGYGQSTTKLKYLPQPIDDSIFAVIAEELGFAGASFIIALFAILALRCFIVAKKAPDKFGQLLLIGFGSLLTLQTFMHIGANSGLTPLTGVPLPFISYGGTALAIFMTISGIMVNVSQYSSL
ncbi:MAG: putative lipid II flippase FtsW [Patescibacteria group bacterium]|nr:putative lipid II flippase FtsW [Patescibacteria group bacterium]